MAKSKARKTLLKLLKTTFSGLDQCQEVDVKDAFRLPDNKVKVHIKDYPFQVNLYPDSKTLHIYPEKGLNGAVHNNAVERYILFDPETYYTSVSGFYRLDDGDKITLGSADNEQRIFLHLSKDLPARKLSIGNDEGWLTFKSHVDNPRSCISPLLKDKKVNQVVSWRQGKLEKLREIFGQPIALLADKEALELIKKVNAILEDEAYRPKDNSGRPGGVVALPDDSRVVLMGDLHAKSDNLLLMLTQNGFLEALEQATATLVLLGDAVHPEGEVPLDEMESSLLIMDLIFKLKARFPKQVFYIRGNHDSYSEEIAKNGIPQGLLWEEKLKKARGKGYRDEMSRFHSLLPYVAYSKHFIACHAAPPTSNVTLEKLINIRDNPKLCRELNNNRMKTPNRPAGYTKGDVKRFRKCLDVAPDTPLIVGHTPMSSDETLWLNVGDIDNHHILYGSDTQWVGVIAQIGNHLYPFHYPVEQTLSIINAQSE